MFAGGGEIKRSIFSKKLGKKGSQGEGARREALDLFRKYRGEKRWVEELISWSNWSRTGDRDGGNPSRNERIQFGRTIVGKRGRDTRGVWSNSKRQIQSSGG